MALAAAAPLAVAGVVVIGNGNPPRLDDAQVQKISSGGRGGRRDGGGSESTQRQYGARPLLRTYLNQDEGHTAYWTVRRYIGKGTPPRTGQRCGGGEFRPDHAGGDRLCGRRRSETGTEYTAANRRSLQP
jgi:hypothetical protein